MRKSFAVLAFIVLLAGCTDTRVKRQLSLMDVKTNVTAEEFNKAPTDQEKIKIADKYFNGLPEKRVPGMKHMTSAVNSYFNHKNPEDPLNLLGKKKSEE